MECSFTATECSVHALHRAICLPWHGYGTTRLFAWAALSNTSKIRDVLSMLSFSFYLSLSECFHSPTFPLPLPIPASLMTKHLSFRPSGWAEFSYSVSSEAACWFNGWSHHHLWLSRALSPRTLDLAFEILPNNRPDLIDMNWADCYDGCRFQSQRL